MLVSGLARFWEAWRFPSKAAFITSVLRFSTKSRRDMPVREELSHMANREHAEIKALPSFAKLHKVTAGNYKIFFQ